MHCLGCVAMLQDDNRSLLGLGSDNDKQCLRLRRHCGIVWRGCAEVDHDDCPQLQRGEDGGGARLRCAVCKGVSFHSYVHADAHVTTDVDVDMAAGVAARLESRPEVGCR